MCGVVEKGWPPMFKWIRCGFLGGDIVLLRGFLGGGVDWDQGWDTDRPAAGTAVDERTVATLGRTTRRENGKCSQLHLFQK